MACAARDCSILTVSGRLVWLTVRHRSMSSFRSCEYAGVLTGAYFPFKILMNSAPWFCALNGCDPVIIS